MRRLSRLADSLTPRGRGMLGFGLLMTLAGLSSADTDLARVGVFLIAAPLLALAMLTRARLRVSALRALTPARMSAGASTRVTLTVINAGRGGSGELYFTDQLPHQLGDSPRFALSTLPPGQTQSVAYTLTCAVRGRFRIGPLRMHIGDPFGLCRLEHTFDDTAELLVLPQTQSLPAVQLHGEWSGGAGQRPRQIAARGEDDVTTRPYQLGDDLRRVHWRSTARLGALTVRREEQPWQSRAALLLDTRRLAHTGDAANASFEYAVRSLASIGTALTDRGLAVRAVTDTGAALHATGGLLDALAVVERSHQRTLAGGLQAMRSGGETVAIGVFGRLGAADVDALAHARHWLGWAVAVLLDIDSWTSNAAPTKPLADTSRVLTQAGWRVLRVGAESSLPLVWGAAGSKAVVRAG